MGFKILTGREHGGFKIGLKILTLIPLAVTMFRSVNKGVIK
jgi:hypothetical protein